MPKAPPPSVLLTFQGRRDFPDDQPVDDWGLTQAQQESYVEQFRRLLAAKNAWREDKHDYYMLRRFLRARSYDLEKAKVMWLNNLKFKEQFKVDTILQDFYFGERDKFLLCYPQGYHKTDKMGRPVYIQLLGQVNVDQIKKITDEDRMLKFHIQEYERCCKVILPVCSQLQGRNVDQTFGIMDVRGVGLSHLTGDVKRLLGLITKYDQDNYPEMLGHICIINAPSIFRMLWSVVKGMLDPRTQGKIEILGTDYLSGLLKWVDESSLPDWLGGKSHGSLLDDVGPWSDPEVLAQLGLNLEELRQGKRPSSQTGTLLPQIGSLRRKEGSLEAGPSFRRQSDMSDNYQSPVHSSTDLSQYRSHLGQRLSGIPDLPEDSQAIRLQSPSLRSTASFERPLSSVHSLPNITAIPETPTNGNGFAPAPKPGTLVQRVNALEEQVAQHRQKLAAVMQNGDLFAANGDHAARVGAVSTRSAPQGSLLYRVEMLEDAMNLLLAAEQISLQNQQRALAEQEAKARQEAAHSSSCCCCTIM